MKRLVLRWPVARRPPARTVPEPAVERVPLSEVMAQLEQRNREIAAQALATRSAGPPTAAEARRRKELEAWNSTQPFEYASHVYVTVFGETRWKCCGNLFVDEHSPWCASPGSSL